MLIVLENTNKETEFYYENTFACCNCTLFPLDFAITTDNCFYTAAKAILFDLNYILRPRNAPIFQHDPPPTVTTFNTYVDGSLLNNRKSSTDLKF